MPGRIKSRRRAKGGMRNSDADFVKSTLGASAVNSYAPPQDLHRRNPVTSAAGLRMPLRWNDQIVWIKTDFSTTGSLNTTASTEINNIFTLSSLPQASALATVFDRFCIYAVTAKVQISTTGIAVGSNPRYFTAIDYDNINAITSVSAIQAYSSCVSTDLATIQSRFFKPCVAQATYQGSLTAFSSNRLWVDSTFPGTQFFGFRFICEPIGATFAGQVTFEFSVMTAFRDVV